MKLTIENIQFIDNYLKNSSHLKHAQFIDNYLKNSEVIYYDIRMEMLDHSLLSISIFTSNNNKWFDSSRTKNGNSPHKTFNS
jgi:hypothetical protein